MADRPDRDLDLVRDAQAALASHLESLAAGSVDPAAPSLLPGWSLGHVLTHLARNADGLTRVLEGAERGEALEQYPGGAESRNAAIEAGAGRPWPDLVADVRESGARFAAQVAAQQRWDGGGVNARGRAIPAAEVPFLRVREVFVHHADLGLPGYGPQQWPGEYAREELRRQTMSFNAQRPMGGLGGNGLPDAALRQPDLARLLWLLGRAEIPGLDPAGTF